MLTYNGHTSVRSYLRSRSGGCSLRCPLRRLFPPLRRICNPTLLDIRIFNPQTRINYICFDLTVEAQSQQAASIFRNKTTTFALTP